MSTTTLPRKKLTTQRAKEVLKMAIANKPNSIYALKQSLQISLNKYENFASCINDQKDIFHTSCHKEAEELRDNDYPLSKMRRGSVKMKELKTQGGRKFKVETLENQQPFFRNSFQEQQRPKSTLRGQLMNRNNESIHTFSANRGSSSFHFWRKTGRGSEKAHRRFKTESDDRAGENTIGDITKFCERKNMKAVNFLVLQLQFNIQDSKRIRRNTGLDEYE